MSTIRTNYILDSAGGNTAQINGGIPAPLASPALTGTPTAPTASLGTNTTQVATTAFALANSTGMTLLGTLTTTSGTIQTLSGLNLTNYKQLVLEWNSVSVTINSTNISTGGALAITAVAQADFVVGMTTLWLNTGTAVSLLATTASNTLQAKVSQSGYSTATTSISVSVSAGAFDAGAIYVYGVK